MFLNIFEGIDLNKDDFGYGEDYKIQVIKKINYALTRNDNEPTDLKYYSKKYGEILDIPNIDKKTLKNLIKKSLNPSIEKEDNQEKIFSNEEIEIILESYNKKDFVKKEQYQDLISFLNDNLSKDEKYQLLADGDIKNMLERINSIITNFIIIYSYEDYKNFKNILPKEYKTVEALIKMTKKEDVIKEESYFMLLDFLYNKSFSKNYYFNYLDKKLLAGEYKGKVSEEEMTHFETVIGLFIDDFIKEYIPKIKK